MKLPNHRRFCLPIDLYSCVDSDISNVPRVHSNQLLLLNRYCDSCAPKFIDSAESPKWYMEWPNPNDPHTHTLIDHFISFPTSHFNQQPQCLFDVFVVDTYLNSGIVSILPTASEKNQLWITRCTEYRYSLNASKQNSYVYIASIIFLFNIKVFFFLLRISKVKGNIACMIIYLSIWWK